MQSVDYRTTRLNYTGTEKTQAHCLVKIARHWDASIRRELRQFARSQWPDVRLFGLVPIHSYRLRKRLEFGMVVWWVEHDIPPVDRYHCESYRVELNLAEPGQPRLIVHSGNSAYPVIPMNVEDLKLALIKAGADTPLVIPRQFGPALDP